MLSTIGKLGWSAAFIYASCAALRLARFNTQVNVVDSRYFVGLASPSAAALVASMVWTWHDLDPSRGFAFMVAVVTALAGILMVANLRYRSLKGIDFKGRVPFVTVLGMAMLLVVVSVFQGQALLIMAIVYASSAPILWLWRKLGFGA